MNLCLEVGNTLSHTSQYIYQINLPMPIAERVVLKEVDRLTPLEEATMRLKYFVGIPVLLSSLVMFGCADSSYRQAFDASHQIKGNSESIAATQDQTWAATLQVLAQQGFMVRSADKSNAIILADREMADQKDKNVSYQITSTVTLVPLGANITQVSLAANQTTELHQEKLDVYNVLGIIPFPVGTKYTATVTQRGTVDNPEFYAGFFDNLKKLLNTSLPVPSLPVPSLSVPSLSIPSLPVPKKS